MTPGARLQAAIDILDSILAGTPAEKALTGWARRSRFAGSKDRAAIRDHVFDALRCRRSFAALGGAETGRGLMIGLLRSSGQDPAEVFDGSGYGPAPLNRDEAAAGRTPDPGAEALDMPDWLWPLLRSSLGDQADDAAAALRTRAPVHLRVNTLKADRETVMNALARDGITTRAHPAADTALEVTGGARKIRNSSAYATGMVELQDAASQAVTERLQLTDGQKVLDFCAGGGGKTLAMAARAKLELFAHDAAPERMRDLPERAQRAGARIRTVTDPGSHAPYDIVLCDAPCSGSGSWRRDPEGKWRLTEPELDRLAETQLEILERAAPLLRPGGFLAYATCSMLRIENETQVARFLERHPDWQLVHEARWRVHEGTDGFFLAVVQAAS